MISVCLTSHNGEKYIKQQVDSILCQLGPKDEIVISDDGSTDNTLSILFGYNDPRIKILNYKQNGKSKHSHWYVKNNFENALNHAMGDIIFLSDQDDYWLPNKVEVCLQELQSCDLVVHNLRITDDELNDQGKNMFEKGFAFGNFLMKEGSYFGCAMAFKRRTLAVSLPFPRKLLVHDIWIGLIAEITGKVHYIADPLILYRVREESISHAVKNSLWYKIKYRVYTLIHLMIRVLTIKLHLRNK